MPLDPAAPLTMGRDPARELPLDDHMCSRLHARVWFESERWNIADCGSRNGTFLNGIQIERSILEPGDLIRVGDRLLVLVDETDQAVGGLKPSRLAGTTFVIRVPAPEKRELLAEQARAQSTDRAVRDAAILCRTARRLHELARADELVPMLIQALMEGTDSDLAKVYLAGRDGRLRCVGESDSRSSDLDPAHLLASLSMANDEALLVSDDRGAGQGSGSNRPGSAISVPIPGRQGRRGAIECYRRPNREAFTATDLDLAIALAQQAGLALENLEHREQLERSNEQLRQELADGIALVGESPAIESLLDQVARAAPTSATVLIVGESGTGKELVARSIHQLSGRRDGPYVAVNCAAFSESLLESELFGHEKGAFTGAAQRRLGQFERANRGTIFLDEIGEMSPACQAKLLRVLEGHPFERVGGDQPVQVDARIVAASHRNLPDLIRDGKFRDDLYYRLRVIELRVPPLRERGDDVLRLASHFLARFYGQVGRGPQRLSEAAADAITRYGWPGNVRELKNAIERAVVLGRGDEVQPEDLGLPATPRNESASNRLVTLAEAERRHIQFVLDQCDGNKTKACEILAIGRGTLYKRLHE